MGKRRGKNEWDGELNDRRRNQAEAEEELNEYIHVTSPGTFVVIVSLVVLFVALMIWGFIGTLPVTETVTGLVVDTAQYRQLIKDDTGYLAELLPDWEDEIVILCFVDASRYNWQAIQEFGDQASLQMPDHTTHSGTVETKLLAPVSMDEARKILFNNEWVLEKCVTQDYNWLLAIRPDEDLTQYTFTLAEVTLLVEEVPPIRFLMK